MCVAVAVFVCVFAIEFQASTLLWLIHEISDVDADGIWLGVLLFLFAFTAVSFAQIWINNLVIRIKNYRKGEAWSITSLFSVCVFFFSRVFRFLVLVVFIFFFFFFYSTTAMKPTMRLVTESNPCTKENTENILRCLTFNRAHMYRNVWS